jgi:hypothetical protein
MGRDGFFVQAGLRVQRPPVHDRGRDRLPTPVTNQVLRACSAITRDPISLARPADGRQHHNVGSHLTVT